MTCINIASSTIVIGLINFLSVQSIVGDTEVKRLEPDIYGVIWLEITTVDLEINPNCLTPIRELIMNNCTILPRPKSNYLYLEYLEELFMQDMNFNPHWIWFSGKLASISLDRVTLINGSLYDLLKTATNLKRLKLEAMKIDGSESVIHGALIPRPQSNNLYLEYLEEFKMEYMNFNPHWITFNGKLASISLSFVNIGNGSLYDLLKSATNLKKIKLRETNIDVSEFVSKYKLTLAKLESFELSSVHFVNGTLLNFLRATSNLKELELYTRTANDSISFSKFKTKLAYQETLVSLKMDSINASLTELLESLPNLQTLELNDTNLLPITNVDKISSMYQAQKLESLKLTGSTFINGGFSDLLGITPNLKKLEIEVMGVIDFSKLIQRNITYTLTSLRMDSSEISNGTLTDFLNALPHLERLDLTRMDIVDISLNYNRKLTSINLWSPNPKPRSVHELVDTATNLQVLEMGGVGDIDLSKLDVKKLKELVIWYSNVTMSKPVVFDNLVLLILYYIETINATFLEDFAERFPKVEFIDTQVFVLPPPILISIFNSPSMKNISFSFDEDPQTPTYEFGEVMKIMKNGGLKVRPRGEPIPLEEKVRFVTFHKQGSEFRYVGSRDYTPFYNSISPYEKLHSTKKFIYILLSSLAFLIICGTLGNALSAFLLLKIRMKNFAGIILLSLTVFDSGVILTYLASSLFNAQVFFNLFVREGEKLQCYSVEDKKWTSEKSDAIQVYFIYPLNKTAYTASVYTTILISLERFIAVCYPLQAKLILSSRNSKFAVMVIAIFSVLLNLPRWVETYEWDWYNDPSPSWNEYYRPTFMRMELYRQIYHGWIWVPLMYVLPFVLICGFNLEILRQIKNSSSIRDSLQSSIQPTTTADTELRSTTKMLLCVVVVFVACNACHIAIVSYFLLSYENIELSTIEAVACIPIIVNCSVNFMIYIMLGKTMRDQFLKLLPKWVGWCFSCRCVRVKGTDNTNIELN